MPRPKARTSKELAAPRAPANRRRTPTQRAKRLNSRTAAAEVREPFVLPVTQLYAWIAAMFLLPACFVTTQTVVGGFGDSFHLAFWRMPAFWFFGMGLVMWLIWFFFLPRPVRAYVFAHEMTHAVFVILCGGSVRDFRVTASGGHVLTDKNNVLISLSPYFVPLYTIVTVMGFLLAGAFFDLSTLIHLPWGGGFRPLWGLFWLIGLTWGFHLTFTLWMIGKDQPDLRINGVFFSLTVIYLSNALLLGGLLILASPELSFSAFTQQWAHHALSDVRAIGATVQAFFQLFG